MLPWWSGQAARKPLASWQEGQLSPAALTFSSWAVPLHSHAQVHAVSRLPALAAPDELPERAFCYVRRAPEACVAIRARFCSSAEGLAASFGLSSGSLKGSPPLACIARAY